MAATEQTLLIPFKGGLDTWSNPHLLPPGTLTASTGTMLDRPGAAYPGPGYTATQWAPSYTWKNHGIGALSHGPNTDADQLVFWSTRQVDGGTGPGISQASGANLDPRQQPLAPWRQITQKFSNDSETVIVDGGSVFTYGSMSSPPQVCIAGGRAFYVWRSVSDLGIMMAYQDLATHAWAGPYQLTDTGKWDVSGVTQQDNISKFAVAGDGTYFRLLLMIDNLGTITLLNYSWLASNPVSIVATSSDITGGHTYAQIDAVGTGDETTVGYGAWVALDTTANQLVAWAFNYSAAGVGARTALISNCQAPIASNVVRGSSASTQFIFSAFITTAPNPHPFVRITDLSLTFASSADVTAFGAFSNPRAMTITNTLSNSSSEIAFAVEYYPGNQSINGKNLAYNRIFLGAATVAAPSVATVATTRYGWGGLALLGKYYGWWNGAEYRPVVLIRSGWFHNTGAWGTISSAGAAGWAYPNGYMYDYRGTLFAKFGDADVGTDSLWLSFDAAGYTANGLQVLPSGFAHTLANGQYTLNYAWPQMGHVDFFSARTGDSGSPIGGRSGLATVSWLAPTASEPPAPMVQFGGSLVVPGTITAYYDGSNVFEAGYFHRCPTPIVAANGGGGSLPDATTYYYQTVAVYEDAAGRVHYSAPSLRVAVTTTAANDKINLSFVAINQTLRSASPTPISIRVYRSTGGATGNDIQMYHVQTIHILNQTDGRDVLTFTATDETSDTNLAQTETIYTQDMAPGASVGTYSPPPFDSVRVWSNQVWGVANRNGPELWCTWPQDTAVIEPEGPAWSSGNRQALPAEIGQPRALSDFDDKLIILGSRTDYGIASRTDMVRSACLIDAPAFTSPVALPTPGGCRVLNGATRLPGGILFQGTQGFSILQRDYTYAPVGTAVKEYARNNLYLPGVLLPEAPAVLLFSASDVTQNLTYFYDTGNWAQPEQPPIGDGTTTAATGVISAARAVAGGSSQMYAIASTQPYYFQVQPFSKYLSCRTPWIQMEDLTPYKGASSVAGYGILREAQVLGILPGAAFGTSQTLTLYTEYDYAGNTNQVPETQSLSLTSGTQADLEYQWRFGFAQGMAKRVRFTVTVNGGLRTSGGSTNPTVLLTGLMLSYSVDAGLSRLGSANSTGT